MHHRIKLHKNKFVSLQNSELMLPVTKFMNLKYLHDYTLYTLYLLNLLLIGQTCVTKMAMQKIMKKLNALCFKLVLAVEETWIPALSSYKKLNIFSCRYRGSVPVKIHYTVFIFFKVCCYCILPCNSQKKFKFVGPSEFHHQQSKLNIIMPKK